MGIRPLDFLGSQPMRDDDSLHIGRKQKTTTGATLQNPNGQHEIRSIHSTELPFPDYVSWYVKDRLAGKITCMVCGEDHYTCDCPMKHQEKKVLCTLCNRVGHCHLWCCRHNVSENYACRRCGEKGHYTNKDLSHWGEEYTETSLGCSSCDINHPLGKCPMGKVTCFLCEGKDHVPAQCYLSPVLTVTQYHRESFRAALKQAMAEKSRRTVTPDNPPREIELYDDSHECQFKVNRQMAPKLLGWNHGEQVNCDRESLTKSKVQVCENINTVVRDDEPLKIVSRVACFNCNYEGHYATRCPKKPQLGELEQYDVTCSNFHANRCLKKTPRELELCDVTFFNCNDKGHYANSCFKKKPPRELATYDDNHGCQSKGGSEMVPDISSFSHGVQDQYDQMRPIRRHIPTSENTNSEPMRDVALTRVLRPTCFNCHDDGHYANRCPKQRAPRKLDRSNVACLNCNGDHYTIRCPKRKKPGELKLRDVTCLSCHDKGHFANRCPKKQSRELEPCDSHCNTLAN